MLILMSTLMLCASHPPSFVLQCAPIPPHTSDTCNRRVPSHEAPYVDEWGEEDDGLERGRPLTLVAERYAALSAAHANRDIARRVTRLREGSERFFRMNWW